MNQAFSLKHHALWSAAALALCCTLTSCGGDDEDGGTGGKAGDVPIVVNPSYTIPPMASKSVPLKARSAALPALGAGAPVATITLPALAATKAALPAPQKGQAMPIGTARATGAQAGADEVARLLQWQPLPGGGQAAALRLVSPGAAGVRLAVDVQALPKGAVLRFYGDGDGEVQEVPAAEAARLRAINEEAGLGGDAARTVWSLPFDGSAATLEVELPAGAAPDAVTLAVPQLSHLMLTPLQAITKGIGDSGSCNLNATCVLDDINAESRAVAKMVFDRGSSTYLCTGTLLNDARSSGTPYFITANHCISTQAEASTLTTLWFYHAAACNSSGNVNSGATQLGGGAQLLGTSAGYDTTLLRLNSQPPAGVVYAGSYWGNLSVGDGTLGVHHPSGDLLKYSVGSITGYAECSGGSCTLGNNSSFSLYRVGWNKGTTEGGSSGSGLFVRDKATGTRYLVGVLHGGDASCSNQGGFDAYGRFDKVYADGLCNALK